MVLLENTSNLYLSCSTPAARKNWAPALGRHVQARLPPDSDYFAIVDFNWPPIRSSHISKVKLENLPTGGTWRGLNLVGLDVVASRDDPETIWVYAINHRPPLPPLNATLVGADSCVEIFKTKKGTDVFTYVRTIEDPEHLITPNDVVGRDDGEVG